MVQRTTPLIDTAATEWFVEQVATVLADDRGEGRHPVLAERTVGGGKMPPLHTRDEGEAYQVTRGIVSFFVGDETISAGPGDVVVAPPGVQRRSIVRRAPRFAVACQAVPSCPNVVVARYFGKPTPRPRS